MAEFTQRVITIRYSIANNPDRSSQRLPEPKHLLIGLPKVFSTLFSGAWVSEKDDDVFVDFFARNEQTDRTGHREGDPWRWIKIKDSGELAMGISRPYTKPRTNGQLVRDYRVGAFKLLVPRVLRAAAPAPERPTDSPVSRRLFN